MKNAGGRSGRKSGGRAARLALRHAEKPVFHPADPGQISGAYKPLTEREIKRIYDSALTLLADLGMGECPQDLVDVAVAKGAQYRDGRLHYPRAMVEDIIDGACKSFIYYGRDNAHDFEVGGNRTYFGTGGAAVQAVDLETGAYRPTTLQDLHDFTRLIDTLPNISWFTRCCIATDVPDNFDLDINTAYALIKNTTKPVGTAFTLGSHVDPIIDMFDMALGGEGRFAERPFCKAHISPVISPMRYGEDAVEVTVACIKRGVPINSIIAAQSGATAPATLAGFLVQSLAETLAGLILVNLFKPRYPVIFSNWPLVIDLRTGAFAGSGGESAVMNAAAAQISNWLGLPSGIASSMADAKAIDAQMGAEKALAAVTAGLSGANMVYESSGMMAALLGASFEAFVLDNEMLGHVNRTLRGVEVNDETLGLDAIRSAVMGEGHFLGEPQTMAAMERDYYYPNFADREAPITWTEKGEIDIRDKARAHAKKVLAEHHPDYLGDADAKIRDRFKDHIR
ncbi:trimethylamine methyltransferase MttB [Rhodobacterales bacterium HTCC2150]|nr:trimethylamine methyltransferase MttB [Rhodobacterales bacterium HTCC2150] [Rhodobacteraceae bacterium HTCC2150]